MSEQTFTVKTRGDFGTGAARAVRDQGGVPGILYGNQQDPVGITLDPKELHSALDTTGFFTRVCTLDINGKKETAIAKSLQRDPITDNPIHIDFMRVTPSSKVTVRVPVRFVNLDKCTALKRGGTLNIVRRMLEVTAAVKDIPEFFTVDLGNVDTSKGIRIEALNMPQGVVPSNPKRDHTIATVKAKRGKKGEGEEEEAA